MKATAVPWPETTRRIMPIATVDSQTTRPDGRIASGRRQARDVSQPAPRPARKGQQVDAMPARVSPLVWLARPMITKMSTQAMSSTTATRAERMPAILWQCFPRSRGASPLIRPPASALYIAPRHFSGL
jgi:hypothetical protein